MRTFKYMMMLLATLCFSCCTVDWVQESEHPLAEGVGQKPEFQFEGASEIEAGKFGGDYEASIRSNLPWLVQSRADWIVVNSPQRNAGGNAPVKVLFSVTKNASLYPREGKIRLWITNDDEAYITVRQGAMTIDELGNDWYVKADGSGDGSSWEKAGDLSAVLAEAVANDKIHLASGTYVPKQVIPGGAGDGDRTFFIGQNLQILGGYPALPKEGDKADPAANPTILSGDGSCYHVMVIGAAKDPTFTVRIHGITLTRGKCSASGTGSVSVNGGTVYRFYGGGLVVSNATAYLYDCKITGNNSPQFNAGLFNIDGAETHLTDCEITRNTAGGNGPGVWNSAATLYLNRTRVSGNSTTKGVGGGIYAMDCSNNGRPTYTYIANSLVDGNATDARAYSRRGGGMYCRENSETVALNTTFTGNRGGNAGGAAVYGSASRPTKATFISCTFTGNEATFYVGGVEATPNTTVNLYNCIVSGNTAAKPGNEVERTNAKGVPTGTLPDAVQSCVVGTEAYDETGSRVVGAAFDPATMLGPFANGVFALLGTANPALTHGMTAEKLKSLTSGIALPLIPEDLVIDQKGNERTGTVMGAYVGK